MTWILFSLLGVICQAAFIEANRTFKADGFRLHLWASCFAALYLLPFIGLMPWPADGIFYIVAFVSAAVSSIGGVLQFHMASKFNGRIVSMYLPVKAFAMFCLWLAIDTAMIQTYTEHPGQLFGITLAFIISVVALNGMRRNDTGWRAFLMVAPLGALFAGANILTKTVFEGDAVLSWVLCFNFLFYIFMALQTAPVVAARHTRDKVLIDKQMIKASAVVALFSVLAFIGILGGIISAPNPAYVGILQMTTPAVIMAYHKLIGVKDDASPLAGMGLIVGAVILIISTQVI